MELIETHPVAVSSSTRARRHLALRIVAWSLLALVLVALAMMLFLRTDAGRRFAANRIEDLVTGQIPGSMQIGKLERLGWLHPVVEDLRFYDPNGTQVLSLERADVNVSWRDLWHGKLGFERVYTHGGDLLVAVQPDGRTGLEAAFSEPGKPTDEKGGGLHFHLREIHVDGLHAVFQVSKDQRFVLDDVHGLVALERDVTDGVHVVLHDISGTLQRKLFGSPIKLLKADGWVHGKEPQVLDLELHARVGKERLNAHLGYFDRDSHSVKLTLDPKGIKGDIAALALEVTSAFSDVVDVRTR